MLLYNCPKGQDQRKGERKMLEIMIEFGASLEDLLEVAGITREEFEEF